MQLFDFKKAEEDFTRASELSPKAGISLSERALVRLLMGNDKEAEADLKKALELSPQNALIQIHQVMIWARTNRRAEALAELDRVIQKHPKLAEAYAVRGRLRLQEGAKTFLIERPDGQKAVIQKPIPESARKALVDLKKACELAPEGYDYLQGCVECYQALDQEADLVGVLKSMVALTSERMEPLNHLAWLLATSPQQNLRDGKAAVQYAQKANDLAGGKDPYYLSTLAAAHAEKGEFPPRCGVPAQGDGEGQRSGQRVLRRPPPTLHPEEGLPPIRGEGAVRSRAVGMPAQKRGQVHFQEDEPDPVLL